MTPGVSRGILQALDAGRISATSAMTTSPWWPEAAGALLPHATQIDIGLHLNLTLGAPLGPMPAFAPAGTLPGIGEVMRRCRRGALPVCEVAAEIERQMDRFLAVAGRAPDHVDGHQHVQVLRPIRHLVVAALQRRGWRPWLRNSGDSTLRILRRGAAPAKALVLAVLARGFRTDAGRLATNDGFSGVSSFDPTQDYAAQFARYLRAPGPRHLVMCHPGVVDDALRRLDPVVDTRERELAFLLSPAFDEVLARCGAELVSLTRATSA